MLARKPSSKLWRDSFGHAQFLWLTYRFTYWVAGSPMLWRYMHHHFKPISADRSGDMLYRRTGAVAHPALAGPEM